MFTGIVEAMGRVESNRGGRLRVLSGFGPPRLGGSVAVNGVCLTVASRKASRKSNPPQRRRILEFDLSPETLKLTNLGFLRPGDAVNLERPLRVGDPLGGHWVLGHVDARSRILDKRGIGDGCARLRLELPKALRGLVPVKGSVAVDGVSLTVTRLGHSFFETVLIPHTLERTTLGSAHTGRWINLEADVMARYLQGLLESRSPDCLVTNRRR